MDAGSTLTVRFPIEVELTVEATIPDGTIVRYEFTGPFYQEIPSEHVLCVELSGQDLTISSRFSNPGNAIVIDALRGEAVTLERYAGRWEQMNAGEFPVSIVSEEDADIFVAPDVQEETYLRFVSVDCPTGDVSYALVRILPVPAFILVAGAYDTDHVLPGGLVGEELELGADLRGRTPEDYKYAWSVSPPNAGSFDDQTSPNPVMLLLDVGTLDLSLTVTEVATGIQANNVLKLFTVEYDGPGFMVDAYGWCSPSLGCTYAYDTTESAIVHLSARVYGREDVIGDGQSISFVWRQDDANPSKWSELTSDCKPEYSPAPPTSAPTALECRSIRGQVWVPGTYRFYVTATDEAGDFSDTDYMEVEIEQHSAGPFGTALLHLLF